MCISPNTLSDGTQVACRNCWQCRADRINDWVGRCIAESKTAVASHAITLTYGRVHLSTENDAYGDAEHPRAAVLTYSDVQKYFKLLRRHGYPLRYFAVGEYGSLKGRAHWHIIAFWQDKAPPHELNTRFLDPFWADENKNIRGVSFWQLPEYESFRYNCKYIMKTMGADEFQGHLSMSKKPPLGAAYFREMAREYARQYLAPQNTEYTFPEAVKTNGVRRVFRLTGASEALFCREFVTAWQEFHGDREIPRSKMIEDFLDPGAWYGAPVEPVDFVRVREVRWIKERMCALLEKQLGETIVSPMLRYDPAASKFTYSDKKTGIVWAYNGQKGIWEWLDADLRKRLHKVYADMQASILEASRSVTPWRISQRRSERE